MQKITVTRNVAMPDLFRISRYEKAPEFGPRILFFSGGSALNPTSQVLKKFTHNSIHLVTPFDSGGSSAILRKAFDMPAIGDLRSRMMALANDSISGNPEVFQFFAHRLEKNAKQKDLLAQLHALIQGKDPRIIAIKQPMRRLIRNHLQMFLEAMPPNFDLRGASIGNLILSAGYLNNSNKLDPVLFMFSKLVNVLGHVTTTVNDNLHLGAELENGEMVYGQHLLTGKEAPALRSPIKDFFLIKSLSNPVKTQVNLQKKNKRLITSADLICYPPGSFYSSIVVNLLPTGVAQSIAKQNCPKVYIPSLGKDPERLGLNIDQSIFKLLDILSCGADEKTKANQFITHIFIDSENGETLRPSTTKKLKNEGIHTIDTRLISPQTTPYYDPNHLVMALLSLT